MFQILFLLAKTAVQLSSKGGKNETEKVLRMLFDLKCDKKQIFRHVKGAGDCERLTFKSSDDALGRRGFLREAIRVSECSASNAVVYVKIFSMS